MPLTPSLLRAHLVPACAVMAMAYPAAEAVAEKLDHVHLTLNLSVSARPPLPSGDVLGLHAVEVLACPAAVNNGARGLTWRNGVDGDTIRIAPVSHRDPFDRTGARIVSTRVRLDRPGSYALGRVVIPSGRYCKVRLTLTRLPATNGADALPALDTSVRLSRPGNLPPMAPSHIVGLELPFAKPWQAGHGNARLTMTLDPSSAAPVLADASLSEGALMRLVMARWVASSQLSLRQ